MSKNDPIQITRDKTSRDIIREMAILKHEFQDELSQSAGEITERAQEIQEHLFAMAEGAEQKIANTVSFIDYLDEMLSALEGYADYHRERLKEIEGRLNAVQNNREKLKENIMGLMDEIDERKIRVDDRTIYTQEFTRLITKNLTEEDKDKLIAEAFGELRTTKYIDKRAVKEAFENGAFSEDSSVYQHLKLEISKSLRGI